MAGDNPLFRLSGMVPFDPAIGTWLGERTGELGLIAGKWFSRMRGCGQDVRELIHDGCPVAGVDDAPFGYVNVFTAHVNVGFYRGSSLKDPAGLLEGSGKNMRHVKLRPGIPVDEAALDALIRASYADIKKRLKAG